MARHGALQCCRWWWRSQKRLGKALLVLQGQTDDFGLLDRFLRRFLDGSNDKVGQGPSFNLGGTFEQLLKLRADPGFQSSSGDSWCHAFSHEMNCTAFCRTSTKGGSTTIAESCQGIENGQQSFEKQKFLQVLYKS